MLISHWFYKGCPQEIEFYSGFTRLSVDNGDRHEIAGLTEGFAKEFTEGPRKDSLKDSLQDTQQDSLKDSQKDPLKDSQKGLKN